MADRILGYKVTSIGGMNTNRDVLSQGEQEPGSATQLINYEPSTSGGYRRVSGYANTYGTLAGTGSVLGVAVAENINNSIFACRKPSAGTDYFYRWNSSTSAWVAITTPGTVTMVGVKKVRMIRFNWVSSKLFLTDGINPAATYDGTTYTQVTHANAPDSPRFAAAFKNHMFLAGDPSEPFNLYFSAPLNETDFSPANGAGVINVGFEIVQIKSFRDDLYIFGKNAIKSLRGTNIADFIVSEVTTNLGCVASDSVVELGGNLLFLGPDGFRPVAGTSKIGDVELETISKQIQFTINAILQELIAEDLDPDLLTSVVIRKKSQFRLFIPTSGTFGLLGGLRQRDGGFSFEFSQLFDFPATCASSGYVGVDEIVIHGDANGKVHKQETGSSFDGQPILSVYQTPYYYFEDPTIRKNFYNLTTFLRSEGSTTISLGVSYDFDDSQTVFNPSNYSMTTSGAAAYYNEAVYDSAAVFDGNPSPVEKVNIEGSGFSIAFKYVTNDTNASHTVQGLVMNYSMNDRR
jgi:hypothetical protein